MKRVLLTGATGFIGRACLEPLRARGYEVHAVAHTHAGDAPVTWHHADLLVPGAARSLVATIAPTHLLHLAWYAAPGKYWTSPLNLAWVRASIELYEAFVVTGGTRVVIGGTAAEYDWAAGTLDERTTPLAPTTYYGTCKRALGDVIAAAAAADGTSAAWARFFFLYGPQEYPERLIASVIRELLQGSVARCSSGTQQRDFLHVADAAEATVALLDSPVTGPVNIASGRAVTVSSLVGEIERAIARGRVELGALPADPVPLITAATHRLRDEVGFAPVVDHPRRLAETIAWWREHMQ